MGLLCVTPRNNCKGAVCIGETRQHLSIRYDDWTIIRVEVGKMIPFHCHLAQV